MAHALKDSIFGPAGLVLLGVVLSAAGAFWAAIQRANIERELRLRSDKIAELSQDALYSVTGGESFCYLFLAPDVSGSSNKVGVWVANRGVHPVYDLQVRVVDTDALSQATPSVSAASSEHGDVRHGSPEQLKELTRNIIEVGNVAPGLARQVGAWDVPVQDTLRLNVFFTARNGSYHQLLRRIRRGNEWVEATRVVFNDDVVLEEIARDFPRDAHGKVDWE